MDPKLVRAGVRDYNVPRKLSPREDPQKSHIVVARVDGVVKTIRFGQQGAKTAGSPKRGESERMKQKRRSFKQRHAKNIARGPLYPAWWADKVKW